MFASYEGDQIIVSGLESEELREKARRLASLVCLEDVKYDPEMGNQLSFVPAPDVLRMQATGIFNNLAEAQQPQQ